MSLKYVGKGNLVRQLKLHFACVSFIYIFTYLFLWYGMEPRPSHMLGKAVLLRYILGPVWNLLIFERALK